MTLIKEHRQDFAGALVTEELTMLPFMKANLVLLDQFKKVPLVVTAQGRFAEMWIGPEKVSGIDLIIGKVAAPSARSENFTPGTGRVIENDNLPATPGRFDGTKKAGGSGTDNNHIDFVHGSNCITLHRYLLFQTNRVRKPVPYKTLSLQVKRLFRLFIAKEELTQTFNGEILSNFFLFFQTFR
jgi:hypothetical protein